MPRLRIQLHAISAFWLSPALRRSAGSILATALIAALCGGLNPARADVIGEARIIDGDTIQVSGERVRLQGIDAPETRQSCMLSGVDWPCGQNAARALTSVTNGKVVTCKGNRRDRYGRLIAICYVGADDLNARETGGRLLTVVTGPTTFRRKVRLGRLVRVSGRASSSSLGTGEGRVARPIEELPIDGGAFGRTAGSAGAFGYRI